MSDRFLIFSDLHIHNHSNDWKRVKDGLAVLEWIREEAIERKIDKVFFLGDFFHVRGYMYPSIVARAYFVLQKFKDAGIELFLLVGNHDMPHKHTTRENCITAFGELANVIEQPMVYEGENHNFWFLPYVESTNKLNWAIDKITQEFKGGESRTGEVVRRAKEKETDKKNVLLAHLDIKGAKFHTNIPSTHGIQADKVSDSFDQVITGHYHTYQEVKDNVWYVGSPYQINWGESGETKGFLIFDDGELEFVENTFSPKHIKITPDKINEDIKGQYVHVIATDSTNIVSIREKASKFEPRHVTVKIDREHMTEARQLINMQHDAKDVQGLLREWIEKTANTELYNHERLFSYGVGIVEESRTE